MLSNSIALDNMLEHVNVENSAVLSRHMSLFDEGMYRKSGVLFSCVARWSTRFDPRKCNRPGPRHETLRRRGQAPHYPRPIDLTRGILGKIVMLREGIALEPLDTKVPCTHINICSLRRVTFYADCAELIHGKSERTLIRCDNVRQLDLKFEAHYSSQAFNSCSQRDS